jgi:hypothetical protein
MIVINQELWEPVVMGVVVSLINKFMRNNQSLLKCCQEKCCEKEEIDARHNAENGINTATTIDGCSSHSST